MLQEEMLQEIHIAVNFLSSFLSDENPVRTAHFNDCLCSLLAVKIASVWYPQSPMYGSGFRAVNIVNGKLDTILYTAWIQANGSTTSESLLRQFASCFPSELVLWIDPGSVSYRKGDHGYPLTLFDMNSSSPYINAPVLNSNGVEPITPDLHAVPSQVHQPSMVPTILYNDSYDADYHQKHALGVYGSPPQSPVIHEQVTQTQSQQSRRSRALTIRAPSKKELGSSFVSVVS